MECYPSTHMDFHPEAAKRFDEVGTELLQMVAPVQGNLRQSQIFVPTFSRSQTSRRKTSWVKRE